MNWFEKYKEFDKKFPSTSAGKSTRKAIDILVIAVAGIGVVLSLISWIIDKPFGPVIPLCVFLLLLVVSIDRMRLRNVYKRDGK
jgi:ABC-type Mn2+/Zn2+ transport system permease subunit